MAVARKGYTTNTVLKIIFLGRSFLWYSFEFQLDFLTISRLIAYSGHFSMYVKNTTEKKRHFRPFHQDHVLKVMLTPAVTKAVRRNCSNFDECQILKENWTQLITKKTKGKTRNDWLINAHEKPRSYESFVVQVLPRFSTLNNWF